MPSANQQQFVTQPRAIPDTINIYAPAPGRRVRTAREGAGPQTGGVENGEGMLETTPAAGTDGRLAASLGEFVRRVGATPPGTCPLAVQLSLLQTGAAQTCGKCVPCRDGLPQLARMLERVVDCAADADEGTLAAMRALAETIRDTSDCAIGYEAARSFLAGLDAYADEYASHVGPRHACRDGVAQQLPCEALCPAHVNVPAYIALVAEGDYAGAVAMIRKDNPFPTACALICEHPCEERCRRTLVDAPVNIRGIKRYAVDHAPADRVPTPRAAAATGRRVAVVGGGPSGLTCAYFLALMGHSVTVFEARRQLGGMMRYGIPAYRFPRERLDEDVRAILGAGDIEVRLESPVGAREMADLAAAYDAVYVAVGAHAGKSLRLPHDDALGVSSAVDLLRAIGDGATPDFAGKRVVVVGGGNVAMDCARTSVRAGAREVAVVYRRRREDMTALASEVEAAVEEGVELLTLMAPLSVEVDGEGRCAGLAMQPQMTGPIRGGRPSPVDAEKPPLCVPADVVLVAVGQDIESAPFEEFGMQANRGRLAADACLRAPGFANVFVGGDCQTGPATVIKAIGAGKVAARNIDELLGYHHKLPCDVEVPPARPNDRTPIGRVNLSERPPRARKRDFACVEEGMTPAEVAQECGRCLRCDHYGCGVLEGGRTQYV